MVYHLWNENVDGFRNYSTGGAYDITPDGISGLFRTDDEGISTTKAWVCSPTEF